MDSCKIELNRSSHSSSVDMFRDASGALSRMYSLYEPDRNVWKGG